MKKLLLASQITLLSLFWFLSGVEGLSAQTLDWVYQLNGSSAESPRAIGTDSDGNVFFCSNFAGTIDADPTAGVENITSVSNQDCLIQKYDANGNYLWSKTWGGLGNDVPWSMTVDNNDNVLIVGTFNSTVDFDFGPGAFELTTNSSSQDGFVLKIDNDGNFLWATSFGGDDNGDEPSAVTVDSNGDIIVVGSFESLSDFDPGPGTFNLNADIIGANQFVWKLDTNGNLIWALGTGGFSFDDLNDVCTDSQDNIIVAGNFSSFNVDFDPGIGDVLASGQGGKDACIIKYNSSGDFQWFYTYGDNFDDDLNAIEVDENDDIIAVGEFSNTVDFDYGPGVTEVTSLGSWDIVVLKLSSTGVYQWSKIIASPEQEEAPAMELTPSGGIEMVGSFYNSLDFDPGPGVVELTSVGSADPYFLSLDSNGDFVDVHSFGTTGFEYIEYMHVDQNGSVYHAGTFKQTIDMDPSDAVFDFTAAGSTSLYLRKLSPESSLCAGDANGDGEVNVLDLVSVSSNFGCTGTCEGDTNQDGEVNILDLIDVSSNFGNICG